jgi:glutathione peroxidase
MQTRLIVAALFVSIVATAGCLVKSLFAASVIHNPTTMPTHGSTTQPASPLDFVVKDIDGKDAALAAYRGKVVMLVNVASKCGFTKQYTDLEAIYKKYADQGFVIIGFPANNFGHQEPGSDADIKEFCTSKFAVTFPMMSKISVKGDDKAPLYKFLTEEPTAGDFKGEIAWNFTKFIVDRNGNVVARFASATTPTNPEVIGIIEKALAAK